MNKHWEEARRQTEENQARIESMTPEERERKEFWRAIRKGSAICGSLAAVAVALGVYVYGLETGQSKSGTLNHVQELPGGKQNPTPKQVTVKQVKQEVVKTNRIVIDFYTTRDYKMLWNAGKIRGNSFNRFAGSSYNPYAWPLMGRKKPNPEVYLITSDRLYKYESELEIIGNNYVRIKRPVDSILKSKVEGEFQRGMDYYEGNNGKNLNTSRAFDIFTRLAGFGHAPSMNALGCMYYHGEDPGQSRFAGSGDLARHFWNEAARKGNQAAKENINKLIRNR